MSGVRLTSENGKTTYEQTIPIPGYLLAIAVGAIVSRPLGKMYDFCRAKKINQRKRTKQKLLPPC